MIRLLAAALLFAPPTLAGSKSAGATCDTLAAALVPGATITLAGSCNRVVIPSKVYSPPVTIDASAATVHGLAINRASGVTWIGGKVEGGADGIIGIGASGYGVQIAGSRQIIVQRAVVSGWARAIVVTASTDFVLDRITMTGLRTDGIDIALSKRGRVTNSTCADFAPAPGDHPDCIQMWSRPGGITSDILIAGNSAKGAMQGFSGFNHIRNGVDDGGFDRIAIRDNEVQSTMSQGTGLGSCRDCVVTGNQYITLPGAPHVTNLTIVGSTGTFCGNDVRSNRRAFGAQACSAADVGAINAADREGRDGLRP